MPKLLKIKVGDVYIDKKSHPVFATAFPKKSKDGNSYYEVRQPVFVQEFEEKAKKKDNGEL